MLHPVGLDVTGGEAPAGKPGVWGRAQHPMSSGPGGPKPHAQLDLNGCFPVADVHIAYD